MSSTSWCSLRKQTLEAQQEKRSSHTLNTYGTESQDTLLYDVRLKHCPIFTSTITEVPLTPLKSSITESVQARREPGRTQIYVYICVYIGIYISGTERACHDSGSLIACCPSRPRETRCTSWWLFFCHKVSLLMQEPAPPPKNVSSSWLWPFRMSSTAKIISDSLVSTPPCNITCCIQLRLCCIQVVRSSRPLHRF